MKSKFTFLIVGLVALYAGTMNATGEEAPKLTPAYDFSHKTLDGGDISLESLKGKAVVINFWATWCVPCKIEMPLLEQAHIKHKANGLVVIGANFRQTSKIINRFLEKNKMTFPILLDRKGELSKKYSVYGLPATYFIDRNGAIVGFHSGLLTKNDLDDWLKKIL